MPETPVRPADTDAVARAAELLTAGGVIAFPTDTVYGLACDLWSAPAVRRIYDIKGRPTQMPLIAMLAEVEAWPAVAASMPPIALALAGRWWPGPLTLIVPARPDLPAEVLGGGHTIGMRIPDHAVARQLLRRVNRPLATTSANRSGHPAATTAAMVIEQLNGLVDLVLDAGTSPQGQASTIVDCTTTPPAILREGPLTAAMLGL